MAPVKSTAMRIAYGFYTADSGEIFVDGQVRDIKSPHDAIALGIGMVHQHFMLVETMTVAENIVLGAEPGSALRSISKAPARRSGSSPKNSSSPSILTSPSNIYQWASNSESSC